MFSFCEIYFSQNTLPCAISVDSIYFQQPHFFQHKFWLSALNLSSNRFAYFMPSFSRFCKISYLLTFSIMILNEQPSIIDLICCQLLYSLLLNAWLMLSMLLQGVANSIDCLLGLQLIIFAAFKILILCILSPLINLLHVVNAIARRSPLERLSQAIPSSAL